MQIVKKVFWSKKSKARAHICVCVRFLFICTDKKSTDIQTGDKNQMYLYWLSFWLGSYASLMRCQSCSVWPTTKPTRGTSRTGRGIFEENLPARLCRWRLFSSISAHRTFFFLDCRLGDRSFDCCSSILIVVLFSRFSSGGDAGSAEELRRWYKPSRRSKWHSHMKRKSN